MIAEGLGPILVLVFLVAALYSSVGHGGASGYIAALSLMPLAAEQVSSTALSLNVFVSAIAWAAYARSRHFDWRLSWPFLVPSVPAAFFGAQIKVTERAYFAALGAVLLYAAIQLWIVLPDSQPRRRNLTIIMASGLAIGFVSGVIGVGGGIFLSPLIVLLGWADIKTAAATSALFILVNSVAGITGRVSVGTFEPFQLTPLILVACLGGVLGATVGAGRLPPLTVRRLLSLVLLIAATKLALELLLKL